VTLYKAMRNHDDAQAWFNQIEPQYYNDILVDWQIRFALKNQNWKQVSKLINHSKNKDTPCWQYWLARSLEEQGKKAEADAIYESLAKSRQYYGFLASIRLKKKPSFENEKPTTSFSALKPYQPIIEQIRTLYNAKENIQASRLLNDFISELPKDEASALVYWVDTELQWHGKSVYLSNNETLNNQLTLRFPLAYKDTVKTYAKQYAIEPEFVYAIIRQESGFREDVTSSAGALGLMQVMPMTASVVSKMSRIPYSNQRELFLSQKNINIGTAYLQQLTKRFSNHPVLVAAAYNAGPRQVVYWLKNHPPKEIDVWIETLPWQETRNYLKNVMAFYVVYQYRLDQRPDLNHFLAPL
jgi:soluble lytic murein transglycosylase